MGEHLGPDGFWQVRLREKETGPRREEAARRTPKAVCHLYAKVISSINLGVHLAELKIDWLQLISVLVDILEADSWHAQDYKILTVGTGVLIVRILDDIRCYSVLIRCMLSRINERWTMHVYECRKLAIHASGSVSASIPSE